MKAHCLFEQSGTFKNEFKKLGIDAEDYDIQNEFGETDHVCDLYAEIRSGYDTKPSIFDNMAPGDIIMSFFRVLDLKHRFCCGLWATITHKKTGRQLKNLNTICNCTKSWRRTTN